MDSEFLKIIETHLEKVIAFRETLSPETDRGCALMAAAYLDGELERLLRAAWVADSNVLNEMLGQSKPLGTFSSRIDIAFLVGLIGQQARRDLHLIRKIRNEFGHVAEPITFESQQMSSRSLEFYHTNRTKDANPRSLFTNAVLGVLAMIHLATHNAKRPQAAADPQIDEAFKINSQKRLETAINALLESLQDGGVA